MGMAGVVAAVAEAVMGAETIDTLLVKEAEIRGRRQSAQYGSSADAALGLELQRVEGRLRVLRADAETKRRHTPRRALAPEDERVSKARTSLAEAEVGLAVATENAALAKATLAEQERDGAPEKARETSVRAIALAESNVRVAQAAVERARAQVREVCSQVEAERLEAARGVVRAKLAEFAKHAVPMTEARAGLANAINAARDGGVLGLEAPPLTLGAVVEYVTVTAERLR